MAYNYYPQYPQYPQYQQQNQQIQNGGFVSVRNEAEARAYPVALGNSITFKDEIAPFIYTKTMGFSQLDTPKFEKYRLVKESPEIAPISEETTETNKVLGNELKARFDAVWGEIEALKSEIKTLKKGDVKNGHDANNERSKSAKG